MRKSLALVLGACLALLIAAGVSAEMERTGRIVQIDAAGQTFTIETQEGEQHVFRVDSSDTRLERDGEPFAMGDLEVGDRVTVYVPDDATGAEPVAARVAVTEDTVPATPPAAEPREPRSMSDRTDPADDEPQRVAQADPMRDSDDRDRADRLPSTAGPIPLIGLAGAVALAAGLLARRLRR